MAKSKLLKEAIADAKAVRETAIANAKIALEEAFTPRLQSILSKKIQSEMEDMEADEDEVEMTEEYGADDVAAKDASEIGAGEGAAESGTDNAEPQGVATEPHTELGDTEKETAEPGKEDEHQEVVATLTEEGEEEEVPAETHDEVYEEEDEDTLDLEAIIRELEGEVEEEPEMAEADVNMDGVEDDPTGASHEDPAQKMDFQKEGEEEMPAVEPAAAEEAPKAEGEMEFDDEIDLDEILREMGYGDDEEAKNEGEEAPAAVEEPKHDEEKAQMATELKEAYDTIVTLRKTINEVNLLNAKLLYTNKLFRSYNLTNEQKVKVVENLDRTTSVREVKLVYATLAESMKFTGTERKVNTKKTMTEGLASKPVASTAPKKEIITESANTMADRFKKLAGIV